MTKEKKLAERFQNPARILAFDSCLKLAAVFSSYNAVERITGKKHQSILKCCDGRNISCLGFYWRELSPELVVDIDEDIGRLTLLEYDRAVGEDRKIYATSKMVRGETILESQYNKKAYLLQKKRNGKRKNKT